MALFLPLNIRFWEEIIIPSSKLDLMPLNTSDGI
jgi:hypothetical protein